jgi:hypothetical protein
MKSNDIHQWMTDLLPNYQVIFVGMDGGFFPESCIPTSEGNRQIEVVDPLVEQLGSWAEQRFGIFTLP